MGNMLQKRPTTRDRIREKAVSRKPFRAMIAFAAGLHAGHGLAHGLAPSQGSFARDNRGRRYASLS